MTALDVLCVVLVVLTVIAIFGRGVRMTIGPEIRLSFTSWPRLVGWTSALLVLRHLLWRPVPWHRQLIAWARALRRNETVRAAWPPFIASRISVLAVAYVAVATIGFDPPRPWRGLPNDVLDLFVRWDSGWYNTIAVEGYNATPSFNPARQNSIAFFPALPLGMRYLGTWLHLRRFTAGIIIVTVAFFLALMYLYRLAREDLPADQARAALLFLAFYPFAACYSAVLTEGPFLLVAVASFFYCRRHQPLKAAPFALVAGLLRPNGFLLAVPLALMPLLRVARARGWIPSRTVENPPGWRTFAATLTVAALPVLGMLLYAAYVHSLTGDPFAWVKAQQGWGRKTAELFNVISERSTMIAETGWSSYARQYPIEIFEAGAALFALGAVWPIFRRFGPEYALFVAMAVLPPFISMGSVSLGRYTAPLFPVFLWLGAAVSSEKRPYVIGVFASGQALVAALFFTWRPPY